MDSSSSNTRQRSSKVDSSSSNTRRRSSKVDSSSSNTRRRSSKVDEQNRGLHVYTPTANLFIAKIFENDMRLADEY